MKPISCGGREDAFFLMKCARACDPIEMLNPISLRHPLSPNVASRLERKPIDLKKITRALEALEKKYDVVVVEGCGGLLVPVLNGFFVMDLIRLLKAETLLVSRSGLGAINHSLLSLEALKKRNIRPLGIIFSRLKPGSLGAAERTNPGVISGIGKVPSLGIFPYIKDRSPKALARAIREHSDLKIINSVLNYPDI